MVGDAGCAGDFIELGDGERDALLELNNVNITSRKDAFTNGLILRMLTEQRRAMKVNKVCEANEEALTAESPFEADDWKRASPVECEETAAFEGMRISNVMVTVHRHRHRLLHRNALVFEWVGSFVCGMSHLHLL